MFQSSSTKDRDPKRIERMLTALGILWRQYPQLRLGQLLVNVESRFDTNPFHVEDDEVEAAIRKVLANGFGAE